MTRLITNILNVRDRVFFSDERTTDNTTLTNVNVLVLRTVSPNLDLDIVRANGGRPIGSKKE